MDELKERKEESQTMQKDEYAGMGRAARRKLERRKRRAAGRARSKAYERAQKR